MLVCPVVKKICVYGVYWCVVIILLCWPMWSSEWNYGFTCHTDHRLLLHILYLKVKFFKVKFGCQRYYCLIRLSKAIKVELKDLNDVVFDVISAFAGLAHCWPFLFAFCHFLCHYYHRYIFEIRRNFSLQWC